jgi:hypothetical protein
LRAVYILNSQATISDELAVRFQDHRPEAVAVGDIATEVASDPPCDARAIQWRGIEARGFRIGKYEGKSIHIVDDELSQDQTWGFENVHGMRECFRDSVSDYNLRHGFRK